MAELNATGGTPVHAPLSTLGGATLGNESPLAFRTECEAGRTAGHDTEPPALIVNPDATLATLAGAITFRASQMQRLLFMIAALEHDDVSGREVAGIFEPMAEEIEILASALARQGTQ